MPRRHASVWLALAGFAVFAALTVLVVTGHANGVDDGVQRWMHDHADDRLRTVARIVTDVLSPPVDASVLLVGAAVAARRRRRIAPLLLAGTVGVVTSAAVIGLKHAVHREPPYLPASTTGLSYPSGHTAATLVFLGTLVLVTTRQGSTRHRLLTAVAAATVLCAAALVYANWHWLTDTLASIAFGVAVLALTSLAQRRGRRPRGTAPPS